jgi:hypothetical protein
MSSGSNDFMLAGTAIAIIGVGMYFWDTRGEKAVSSFNNAFKNTYEQPQVQNIQPNNTSSTSSNSEYTPLQGGKTKRKKFRQFHSRKRN